MEAKAMSGEVMVRLNLKPQSFGCMVVEIDPQERRKCSPFHWQIFKCRSILHSYPKILAAPDPSSLYTIIIVANQNLIQNGYLDVYLKENRLRKKHWGLMTTQDVVQNALRYSLIARVAPQWNAISCKAVSGAADGDLLLRGSDFLTQGANSPIDAVAMRVFVADSVAWLGVRACRARLPTLRLEDLHLSSSDIEELLNGPKGLVGETSIGLPWVHVIPSLKRGRVIQLSRRIPLDSPFKTYEELQRHWKQTYGFILPNIDPTSPPIFASVSFLIGGRSFLYPLHCLMRTSPPWLRHDMPGPLIRDLVGDLKKCFARTDLVVDVAGRPIADVIFSSKKPSRRSPPNLISGNLEDLLFRETAPLEDLSDEEDPSFGHTQRSLSFQPKPASSLHFMSRLAKTVRQASERPKQVPKPVFPKSGRQPLGGISSNSAATTVANNPDNFSSAATSLPEKPNKLSKLVPHKGLLRPQSETIKKVTDRKTSQPRSDEDLGNLLQSDDLRKATVAQLQQWLRGKGFEVRGRPKKEDLIVRVRSEAQKADRRPMPSTAPIRL